jgi:hypothetical protein
MLLTRGNPVGARDRALLTRLGIAPMAREDEQQPLVPPEVREARANETEHVHGPDCAHGGRAPVRPGSACNVTRQR